MIRRAGQTGFTLLEILVVVTLVAGIAAFVMPALLGDNPVKEQRAQADRVSRLLTLASDYSLFRGQLVALLLSPEEITPLVFSLEEQDFVSLEEEGLRVLALEEPLQLEWELDAQAGEAGPTLADAALAATQPDKPGQYGEQESPVTATEETPQLFFFPSGEATTATMMIRHPDSAEPVRLQLDAMGRVRDPDAATAEEEGDDETL